MRTSKILHCLRAPVGGLFRHVVDLAAAQAALGLDVGVVCDRNTGGETSLGLQKLEGVCRLGVTRVPMSRQIGIRDLTAHLAIRRLTTNLGVDVLHGHGAKGGAYARLVARDLKGKRQSIRAFYTPHGGSLHYWASSLKGRIYLDLERRLAQSTDGFVFESDFSRKAYEAKVGRPSAPVRVIPNGLHPHEFYQAQVEEDAADFVFVGELRRLKGVDALLDALARIDRRRRPRVVIVGSGSDEPAFRRQAAALGVNASFAGPMPAAKAFARGRCLIVPSRAESLPYVVLEAAAAQLPMIATDVGGIPEIVRGAEMELVPPGRSDELGEQMEAFLADPMPFVDRAKLLQKRVEKHYTVARMTHAIVEFYFADLIGERAA